jgi:hypothetical protein
MMSEEAILRHSASSGQEQVHSLLLLPLVEVGRAQQELPSGRSSTVNTLTKPLCKCNAITTDKYIKIRPLPIFNQN